MAEFRTWRDFWKFEHEVMRDSRFVRSEAAEQFLNSVRNSCKFRQSHISRGRKLWRAQQGHDWRYEESIDSEVPAAFRRDRMLPLIDRAIEGRANPRGIPVVYLCTNKESAMSETRPWLGSYVSLGLFQATKDLRLVDCTRDHQSNTIFYLEEPPEDQLDSAVWAQIDRAFTKPVTRNDDTDTYVATQILAELFKHEGFDGIAYGSAFDVRSTNFALFSRDSVELTMCELHQVTDAKLNFRERDNPYFVRSVKSRSAQK